MTKRLISEPLALDVRHGNARVNPQQEPERFMKELPEAYGSSRCWATVREEPTAVKTSLDIPLDRGDV